MPDMPGMNIIVASADPQRLYAAVEAAMAAKALGRPTRLFLQGEAAGLLRPPMEFDGDGSRAAAGQLRLSELFAEAMAMEVEFILCQSGLALAGLSVDDLPPQVRLGGLVSFLAGVDAGDRLITY